MEFAVCCNVSSAKYRAKHGICSVLQCEQCKIQNKAWNTCNVLYWSSVRYKTKQLQCAKKVLPYHPPLPLAMPICFRCAEGGLHKITQRCQNQPEFLRNSCFREGWLYQIGLILGKIPNGLRPPPPHFWKIMLQFFMMTMVAYMQGGMMARQYEMHALAHDFQRQGPF